MPNTYKVLGQIDAAATTLEDLYTVPGATQAVVSSIVVANRTGTARTFRISIAVAGAADNPKQYIAYDCPIAANDVVDFLLGVTLGAADKVRVYSSAVSALTFSIYGEELS